MMTALDLVGLAPFALLGLDERRRVTAANPEAQAFLGHSERAMYRKPLSEILFHDSPVFDLIDKAMALQGDVSAHAIPVNGPSLRAQRVLDLRLRPLHDGGIVIGMIEASETAVVNNNPAGVAAFGRILGHEVKNPLAGISGAAQLLSRNARDDQSAMIDIIQSETRRIERLVSRLSAFELFSAPVKEALNIHELLDRVIAAEEAAHRGKVSIIRLYDPSLPEIMADQDHLHEAVQNILRNAVEATISHTQSPQIQVETAFETSFAIAGKDGSERLGRAIRVTIEDNGPGVPPEKKARMFDMFMSSKSGGRGLGLSVVNEIMSAHNGRIKVDSKPGLTRFSIFLPLPRTKKS
ncbi:MAG: two-component system sensor histidine kinase NtrB [Henriciella sp.]|nr:ATP-binding protein [Hyphomonadaceae bacterium]